MKILLINDMNQDFAKADGKLYVPEGEAIIPVIQRFVEDISPSDYDYVFIVNDLHFSGEYERTEESLQFPPHCMYGTTGASMAVGIEALHRKRIPVYFMNKNYFSMWDNERRDYFLELEKANPDNLHISMVYKNLFHVDKSPDKYENPVPRDIFFPSSLKGWQVDVVGLAADYCVRYAVEGLLQRGAEVTVFANMTKGISKDIYAVAKEINSSALKVEDK